MIFANTASQNRPLGWRRMKEAEERARAAKPLRDPRDPTASERDIHEATH